MKIKMGNAFNFNIFEYKNSPICWIHYQARLNGKSVPDVYGDVIIHDILLLASRVGGLGFYFVSRRANTVAHFFTQFNVDVGRELLWEGDLQTQVDALILREINSLIFLMNSFFPQKKKKPCTLNFGLLIF